MLGSAVLLTITGAATSLRGESGDDSTKAVVVASPSDTPAPVFVVPALGASAPPITLDQFDGRPLVINFFASWCVPCRKEMPALQSVYERFEGSVAFLGIDHEDSRNKALDLVARTGVTYPTAYDPEGRLAGDFEVRGLPTTVFVSSEGRIVGTRLGELDRAELEEALVRLFAVTPDREAPIPSGGSGLQK